MTAPCNVNCSCSLATINPVCGEDNLVYFSPCHAGCKVSQDEKVIAKKYLLCLVKLDCKKPLTMLTVLLGSCVSARLIRGTGLREEWHGRRCYLPLPFSHSYDLPICNLRSFRSYTNTKLERRSIAHQNSLAKYLILNSKCFSTRIFLKKMLGRYFPLLLIQCCLAKVLLPWSTLIRRKKKKKTLIRGGSGRGHSCAV